MSEPLSPASSPIPDGNGTITAMPAAPPAGNAADVGTLARYRDAWDHAADRTPHGKPIELKAEDFR